MVYSPLVRSAADSARSDRSARNRGASGAISANETAGVVLDDPNNDINQAIGNGDYSLEIVNVPAGTAFTRFAIRNADVAGVSDIDLYVFDSGFNQVGGSGSGTSHETVDLVAPADTMYYVLIHGWETDGPSSPYVLYDWSVPFAPDGGSLSIGAAPGSATIATTGTVTLNWTGIDDTKEQMGVVVHNGPGGVLAVTGVELNVID